MTKFSELNLNPKVLKAIEEAGYETPTPIQEGAIPPPLKAAMYWELHKPAPEKQPASRFP